MFSSNSIKFFSVLVLLGCQSCSYWRGQTNATPVVPPPFVAEPLKSAIPFSTKEPDVYQAEIVTIDAGGVEEKTFAAKNGANQLLITNFQGKTETAFLQIGANRNVLLAPRQKIYAEDESSAAAKNDGLNDFLKVELINRKTDARFERLGAENNLEKYRATLDDASNSEIIIHVDANLGLPVRQEFYSVGGEQKTLILTVELRNFNLQAEAGIFEIPKNYRKVSPTEFRETMRRER